MTEVLRFCTEVFYQIQSMRKSCEKPGPPRRRHDMCSEAALLRSEALWRKGRKFNLCSARKFRALHRRSWGLCAAPRPAPCCCIWAEHPAGICQGVVAGTQKIPMTNTCHSHPCITSSLTSTRLPFSGILSRRALTHFQRVIFLIC